MAKTDAGKKVAKVGKAGSGSKRRSSSDKSGSFFPIAIGLVVVVGTVLIFVSRDPQADVPPKLGEHWHAAFDIYLCDDFVAQPVADLPGAAHHIHTHQDGLIHIHPGSGIATGENATIGYFTTETDWDIDSDQITLGDGTTYTNGDDCDGEPGSVQLATWPATEFDETGRATAWTDEPVMISGNPADHRPQDDELLTFAFVADGTDIPRPRAAAGLAAPVDEGGAPLDLTNLGDADQREQGAADADADADADDADASATDGDDGSDTSEAGDTTSEPSADPDASPEQTDTTG